MISLKEACEKAKKVFIVECGCDQILEVLETEDCWLISCGSPEEKVIGGYGVIIYKQTGEVEDFILPSEKGFELLDKAIVVEF